MTMCTHQGRNLTEHGHDSHEVSLGRPQSLQDRLGFGMFVRTPNFPEGSGELDRRPRGSADLPDQACDNCQIFWRNNSGASPRGWRQ